MCNRHKENFVEKAYQTRLQFSKDKTGNNNKESSKKKEMKNIPPVVKEKKKWKRWMS